ncbi:MAG: G-protein coupled receptor, partial [Alteromonas sp.]|nr:G-protein coupled receptor [Alteromonas sp.]
DAFTGILTFPMHAAVNFLYSKATSICWLRLSLTFVGYFFGTCGLLTLLAVATDRYIAVFHPYRYGELTVSKKNMLKPLAAAWTISFIFVGLSFLTPNFLLYSIFVFIILVVLCIWSVYSQGKILKITRQIIREIRPCQPTQSPLRSDGAPLAVSYDCRNENIFYIPTAESIRMELKDLKRRARDHLSAAKVTVSIIAAQYICYIPHGVVVNLYMFMSPTTSLHMAHG